MYLLIISSHLQIPGPTAPVVHINYQHCINQYNECYLSIVLALCRPYHVSRYKYVFVSMALHGLLLSMLYGVSTRTDIFQFGLSVRMAFGGLSRVLGHCVAQSCVRFVIVIVIVDLCCRVVTQCACHEVLQELFRNCLVVVSRHS